jgi:hypothetical protein
MLGSQSGRNLSSQRRKDSRVSYENYDEEVQHHHEHFEEVFERSSSPYLDDVAQEAISIIRSAPTIACAEGLSKAFYSTYQKAHLTVADLTPSFAPILTSTHNTLVEDEEWGTHSFAFHFDRSLSELLVDYLNEEPPADSTSNHISPTNNTLLAALLTPFALRDRLITPSSNLTGFTAEGFQLPDYSPEAERQEVTTLGACLQVAAAKGAVMEHLLDPWDTLTVAKAARSVEKQGVVNYTHGKSLLAVGSHFAFNAVHKD